MANNTKLSIACFVENAYEYGKNMKKKFEDLEKVICYSCKDCDAFDSGIGCESCDLSMTFPWLRFCRIETEEFIENVDIMRAKYEE